MPCDPRTSTALIDTLFTSGSMGLCLFDEAGKVVSIEGAASVWAPPPGAMIDDATLFVGMRETFADLRRTGESFLLSGVSIGSDDLRALDVRILWVADIELFAALSSTATERNQLQHQVSQVIRDNRLLEDRIRRQQEKIAEQAELMELFIRHVPAAVAMIDSSLEPMMVSRRWIEEFGDPSLEGDPEIAGSPLEMADIDAALRLAMDNGVTSSRVQKISRQGAVLWKRWEQTPWRRADRSIGGSILYFEDVTDEMRKAANLRARVEEFERLSRSTRRFGAAVTGDLRAPLREIVKEASALSSRNAEDLDRAGRESLGRLSEAAGQMEDMLDALRAYLAISSSAFAVRPFDLAEAAEDAANALRDQIVASGVEIVMGPTLSVNGDRGLVSLVLRHVFDNAIKYAGGAPRLSVACHDEDDTVVLTVTDDGPGVPAHLRERAFEPFARLEPMGKAKGAGMGLTIARRIVERHGGVMAIDPDYDLGLRVVITLPRDGPVALSSPDTGPKPL